MKQLSWLEIDLSAIAKNVQYFKNFLKGKTKLLAVVKSNAYGHGLTEVGKTAEAAGADWLGVGSVEEGLTLRKAGVKIPILVFLYPGFSDLKKAIKENLVFTVWDKDTVRIIAQTAKELKTTAKVHLKVDTGMHRLGAEPAEAVELANFIYRLPNIELEGVYSHFATATSRDKSFVFKQLSVFHETIEAIEKKDIKIKLKHIANTAACLSMTSSHLSMVRVGLGIYGLFPTTELRSFFELKPALTWKTKIVAIKKVKGGEKVGYDGIYTTPAPQVLGIVPVGYADGLDRKLSNVGKMIIRNKRVPIVGRISMNMTILNLSDIENPKIGEDVIIIGKAKTEQITAGELAGYLDTIPYEIVTRIAEHIPKKFIKGGKNV